MEEKQNKIKETNEKNIQEEYTNSNDIENIKLLKISSNKETNIDIQDTYYKKIFQICIFCIIFIKISFIIFYKINNTSNLKNIQMDPYNYITNEKIFWKNNTEVNITKANEEITSYINMKPSFNNRKELHKRNNP